MLNRKYLATNQEEVTVGDAAGNTLLQMLNKLIESICDSLPTSTFDLLSSPNVSLFQIRKPKSIKYWEFSTQTNSPKINDKENVYEYVAYKGKCSSANTLQQTEKK